jgi:hypothetical protein
MKICGSEMTAELSENSVRNAAQMQSGGAKYAPPLRPVLGCANVSTLDATTKVSPAG